ncbi:hypothetical protein ACHAQA_006442 [Verticillium albo-atrum]
MTATGQVPLPCLKKVGGRWQLQVDGKPWLILGGELQNSSMSSARYMRTVWDNLRKMGINTVLGPVTWEDIEPEEGRFEFTELDAILRDARAHGFRLILLWFGSFKNGMSCYAPSWVKTNIWRFPRMQLRGRDGVLRHTNVISILHEECIEADQNAFSRMMEHIREHDGQRTVIAVQIQNEVGLLGGSRDVSSPAEKVFQSEAPADLVEFFKTEWDALSSELTGHFPVFATARRFPQTDKPPKTWEQHFGISVYTDELFMAYHYAAYVEKLAVVGRQTYDIPLFTNAWLPKPGAPDASGLVAAGGAVPGEYPSGGPTPGMLDVWERFAPTLDFISPDIYAADYGQMCQRYSQSGKPFFIPEQRRDEYGARRIWEAIGSYGALGATPFGVDTLQAESCSITSHYKLLSSVSSQILEARAESRFVCGFFFDEWEGGRGQGSQAIVKLAGAYELTIGRAFVFGEPGPGFGLIIELEPTRFLLVGKGFKVEFASRSPTAVLSGILRFEEKEVVDEAGTRTFRTDRRLNGDETRSGAWANMPNDAPHYGAAFIPIAIPARTGIAEVTVYSVEEGGGRGNV